jgi:predicted DNA-binding transcriptional regulator YafY
MCRRVRFAYRSHAGAASRCEIEPYGVIHTDGRWDLIGHCPSRGALRTFRLDRVADLEVCVETFKRPTDFDTRTYLRERMPFVQSEYQIDVWMDMPIEEAERTFASWRVATEEGRDETALWPRSAKDVCGRVLSMGRPIVVHEPAELRETFRELAHQAMQAAQQSERHSIGAAPEATSS